MTQKEKLEAATLLGEKINAFIGAIDTPAKPDLPDKPGTKWVLDYTFGKSVFQWKAVEDANAPGTSNNPLSWESGMSVKANYWYDYNGVTYACIQSGAPEEITTEYFEQM